MSLSLQQLAPNCCIFPFVKDEELGKLNTGNSLNLEMYQFFEVRESFMS